MMANSTQVQNGLPIPNVEYNIQPPRDTAKGIYLIFSPAVEEVGVLKRFLEIFEKHQINLIRIESRPSAISSNKHEFVVELHPNSNLQAVVEDLRKSSDYATIISPNYVSTKENIPWFPRKLRDLDRILKQIESSSADIDSTHPGFADPTYKSRRRYFADVAASYKPGQAIPRVEYTEEEMKTWGRVFKQLTELFPTHACKELNHVAPTLVQSLGYSENNIPQLEDVSNFLKDQTGFTIRPIGGPLSPRDVLNSLAFRVFHFNQFIRHSSQILYTPEPDICHELLGHVPLFANPDFAQFAQELGIASLGVSDDDLMKLARIFWFTIEQGLVREKGDLKAFGAGLLGAPGELMYALQNKAEVQPFDPINIGNQIEFPMTEYQPLYFVANDFVDIKIKLMKFSETIPRSFTARYNAYTQNIEVMD